MADQPSSTIFSASDKDAPPEPKKEVQPAAGGDTTQGSAVAILVGEGRKYKSVEDLAKAYMEGDGFLEKLKDENRNLREELVKSATFQDVLERLKAPPSSTAPDKGEQKGQQNVGLSAADVAQVVRDTITGMETARTRESNLLKADAAMKKLFGEKAKEMFNTVANTPEMRAALMALGSVSPEKFVAIFQPAQQGSAGAAVDSQTSVNTAALQADTGAAARVLDPGNKEFYDQMRKKEPSKYYSHEWQLKMHNAAQVDSDKFFGRKK